jgi:uncharacterized LabA/DUF88 family protein
MLVSPSLHGVASARRWMLFVDGENFALRGQEFAKANGFTLKPGKYFSPNVFLWLPNEGARNSMIPHAPLLVQPMAIRAHYYTSAVGDEVRLQELQQALWELGFHGEVFKKEKRQQKSKGVDITLARDFLANAFMDNYDAAVLMAGDADYLPIVNEVKRMGKLVYVIFFHGEGSGLSRRLHIASDQFFSINQSFEKAWRGYSTPSPADSLPRAGLVKGS